MLLFMADTENPTERSWRNAVRWGLVLGAGMLVIAALSAREYAATGRILLKDNRIWDLADMTLQGPQAVGWVIMLCLAALNFLGFAATIDGSYASAEDRATRDRSDSAQAAPMKRPSTRLNRLDFPAGD